MSKIAVACNGGKDGLVVLNLVYRAMSDIYVLCIFDEETFEEQVHYMKEILPSYYPEATFKYYKGDILDMTWRFYKEYEVESIFMGIRQTDPKGSMLNYTEKCTEPWPPITCHYPLLTWNYNQVWDHILTNGLPYCSLYRQGYTSLGAANKTTPNIMLKTETGYLPAYMLEDERYERWGREA
jgi:FAD synthetase